MTTLSIYVGMSAIALGIAMLWSSTSKAAISFWSIAILNWNAERSISELIEGRLVIYGIGVLLVGVVLVFAV